MSFLGFTALRENQNVILVWFLKNVWKFAYNTICQFVALHNYYIYIFIEITSDVSSNEDFFHNKGF